MSKIRTIPCPYCQQPLLISSSLAGTQVQCPKCSNVLNVNRRASAKQEPIEAELVNPEPSGSTIAELKTIDWSQSGAQFDRHDPVQIDASGNLHVNWKTKEEAKLAKKQLKLLMRIIALAKKTISTELRQVEEQFRTRPDRQRIVRGGGVIGSIIRIAQHAVNDSARLAYQQAYEQATSPLRNKLLQLDKGSHEVELHLLRIDTWLDE